LMLLVQLRIARSPARAAWPTAALPGSSCFGLTRLPGADNKAWLSCITPSCKQLQESTNKQLWCDPDTYNTVNADGSVSTCASSSLEL